MEQNANPSPQATPSPARGPQSPAFWVYIDKARMSPDIATSRGWLDKALAEVGRTNYEAPAPANLREVVDARGLLDVAVSMRDKDWWKENVTLYNALKQVYDAIPPAAADAGLREAALEAIDLADAEVTRAHTAQWEGKETAWRISIPANPKRDTDLIIGDALNKARAFLASSPQEQGAADAQVMDALESLRISGAYCLGCGERLEMPHKVRCRYLIVKQALQRARPEEQGEATDLEADLRTVRSELDDLNSPHLSKRGMDERKEAIRAFERIKAALRSRTPSQGGAALHAAAADLAHRIEEIGGPSAPNTELRGPEAHGERQ